MRYFTGVQDDFVNRRADTLLAILLTDLSFQKEAFFGDIVVSGALMLRKRGSNHSSSGAPINAVTEPVDTSIHTRVSQRMI